MTSLLSADSLNDFISPGAVCIKPVETPTLDLPTEVEIQTDENGNPLEITKIDGKMSALSPAQISLADCLACSGCITSAEEVLVAQHSHEQLLKALRSSEKSFVVSISHQSRASLAHAYGYSVENMDKLLIHFFKKTLGFSYVVGTALGRKLSLLEEATNIILLRLQVPHTSASTPILSSICPGWVLYAEKTHPYVLPYMSAVKSPQQITGCILKTLAAKDLGMSKDNIYHLSIMPCFDKKLESARPEKDEPDSTVPDVDCVLTAKELVNLIETSEFDLFPADLEQILQTDSTTALYDSCAPHSWISPSLSWANDSGSESGGYAYNVIQMAKSFLEDREPEIYKNGSLKIVSVDGKNPDIFEYRLMFGEKKLLSTAVVNGFKNIQNLVRRLKPEKTNKKVNPLAGRRRARTQLAAGSVPEEFADASKCDYVEIMACPSGCINGGGQISGPIASQEKEWLAEVREVFHAIVNVDLAGDLNLRTNLSLWLDDFI